MTEDNQSQVLETQALAAPTPEMPTDSKAPVESARDESNQSSAANRSLSKQEIKSLQIKLKAIGFDPGALDGVAGAQTILAFRRLQSACVNLKDILEYSVRGIQPAKQAASYDRTFGRDETRIIQVRLNDAGFNVGSIDGVMGHKTRSALARFQSGCTAIKDLPGSLENSVHGSKSGFENSAQPDLSKPIAVISSVGDKTRKLNVAEEQVPSREEVRLLQEQLQAAGFDPGPVDGILGPKTKSALQQYRAVTGSSTSQRLSSSIGHKSDY
jgi:peptidoglycan hydrolase-like protein with peptidoglycan-binding domain